MRTAEAASLGYPKNQLPWISWKIQWKTLDTETDLNKLTDCWLTILLKT